jgi:hypothetical protein
LCLRDVCFYRLSQRFRNLAHELIPEAQIRIGGVPAIQSELSTQLLAEFKIFALLSLGVFGLIFFIFFQGFSASVLTLATLLFVNLVTAGLLCYLQIPFSLLLSTLPIILSVAVVSIMIHTMHRWAEIEIHNFRSAIYVIGDMFKANFLGSITTALVLTYMRGSDSTSQPRTTSVVPVRTNSPSSQVPPASISIKVPSAIADSPQVAFNSDPGCHGNLVMLVMTAPRTIYAGFLLKNTCLPGRECVHFLRRPAKHKAAPLLSFHKLTALRTQLSQR